MDTHQDNVGRMFHRHQVSPDTVAAFSFALLGVALGLAILYTLFSALWSDHSPRGYYLEREGSTYNNTITLPVCVMNEIDWDNDTVVHCFADVNQAIALRDQLTQRLPKKDK